MEQVILLLFDSTYEKYKILNLRKLEFYKKLMNFWT